MTNEDLIGMILDFQKIKQLVLYKNTSLTSNATIVRMFSFETQETLEVAAEASYCSSYYRF